MKRIFVTFLIVPILAFSQDKEVDELRNDLNKCCVDKNYPSGDILDPGYPVVSGDTELLEDKIGKLEKQLDSIQTKIYIDDLKITLFIVIGTQNYLYLVP